MKKNKTKNNIDPNLIKKFKKICEVSDGIIKSFEKTTPVCFVFERNKTAPGLITLSFKTAQEKEFLRLNLMQHLAKIDLSGYIIIFDATCTILNQKTGDREVSDAVTRTLYTQKERLQEIVFYKDKKIIKKQKIKTSAAFDNWDLWNNGLKYNDKNDAEYQKYKKENPELYKDIPQ